MWVWPKLFLAPKRDHVKTQTIYIYFSSFFHSVFEPPETSHKPPEATPSVPEMGQFFILRSKVQQEYNGLLVNALNCILKSNLS